ncbi:hypothetical protein [Gordonia phthalatica]|uniref:hypothetical protein n=1 Tax=Gordonia phthalatica TaxID=1136941 RepID=UPI000A782672|nr:hypothetical protein [Gordonia phthalatica]
MSKTEPIDFSQFHLSENLTITVAWRSGNRIKLGRVAATEQVRSEFLNIISGTVENISERSAEPWSAEADITSETYLVADANNLGDHPELVSSFQGRSLFEALGTAESIPVLDAGKLPAADMTFYALTVGDIGHRVTFLRRSNPRRGLRKGRVYTSFRDSLSQISDPVFAFDYFTDIVFIGDKVIVLSTTAFGALFRSQEEIQAQVPRWTDELSSHVPISEDAKVLIIDRALKVTRIRTRLESIVTRGHLQGIETSTLRGAMNLVGMNPDEFLDSDGNLTLTDDNVDRAITFLNEDLFAGSITETPFRADKKAMA